MKREKLIHAAKFALFNFECGQCETGVVQVREKLAKNGIVTTSVHGCLDCGYEYGLRQASELNKYTRDDITWP